ALLLMGELEYLLGNYEGAKEVLEKAMASAADDLQTQVMAQVKLLFVYYQTNQFTKSRDLLKGMEAGIVLPLWDWMKTFDETPYQVEWHGAQQAVIPFEIAAPLPVIPVEIQGVPIYAFIDTGGDAFILDNGIAETLGIEAATTFMGTFAGGLQAEIGFARADSLKLGDVTITNVPINILPTERFSEGFAEGQYTIGGIVGTGVLRQFLPTIDYLNGRLVLRPRSEEGLMALQGDLEDKTITEVPFVLAAAHMMMAQGRLNDKEDLTFFVDSGLATEAALSVPIQTLHYAGIPVPETAIPKDNNIGGGGGKDFATGNFPIEKLGLGPLVHEDVSGIYGILTPESYWQNDFIQDGLISHQFLRHYAWTIDFSEMTMILAQ
ncbi:MAG: retropepsin-like aspartic protease, partial [Anaerolineae bacterium]